MIKKGVDNTQTLLYAQVGCDFSVGVKEVMVVIADSDSVSFWASVVILASFIVWMDVYHHFDSPPCRDQPTVGPRIPVAQNSGQLLSQTHIAVVSLQKA